ncbi:TPR repeat protein [Natronospira proteinivora]|uniref:TPR repeat protein n=1 Tax=Natronospira proteinivora TaxID=1807133 RepID=A0ABT1G9Q2_9GAMM|nr:hypothetical protein [Natronospira proteinivora]MCP1728054.1 TPR repeat protein [Natronospira proteinivora]
MPKGEAVSRRSSTNDVGPAIQALERGEVSWAYNYIMANCDTNDPFVLSVLGKVYLIGSNDVPQDVGLAVECYERSASEGDVLCSYYELIKIYFYGFGGMASCEKAVAYCRLLAEESKDPRAIFHLGRMAMEGRCMDKDIDYASKMFKQAWDSGYVYGLTYMAKIDFLKGRFFQSIVKRIRAVRLLWKLEGDPEQYWRIELPL